MVDNLELRELRRISKILLLSNAKAIENALSELATTDDRKRIWVLLDGKSSTKAISDKLGRAQRTVQVFLRDAKLAELIDYNEDMPRRLVDYVPPSWLQLVAPGETQKESESAVQTNETLDGPINDSGKGAT